MNFNKNVMKYYTNFNIVREINFISREIKKFGH